MTVQQLLSEGKHEEALAMINQSADKDKDILVLKGSLEQELGLDDEAIKTYQQLIKIDSKTDEHWFAISELQQGSEAVKSLLRGIELSTDPVSISNACCSLVELYMSDLCEEPDAEQQCEQAAAQGVMVCPSNAEVWMTLASLRFTQQRYDEALGALTRNLQLWLPQDILSECDLPLSSEVVQLDDLPQYDSRLNIAKLATEMNLYDVALVVLETCSDENDQDCEVPYLKALVFWQIGLEIAAEELGVDEDAILEDPQQGLKVADVTEAWSDASDTVLLARSLAEKHSFDGPLLQDIKDLYALITSIVYEEDHSGQR